MYMEEMCSRRLDFSVHSCCWLSNGIAVVSGGHASKGIMRLFKYDENESCLQSFSSCIFPSAVTSLAPFSEENDHVIGCEVAGKVFIMNMETHGNLWSMQQECLIHKVTCSRNNELATCGSDGWIRLWDVRCNGAVGEIGTKRPEHSRDCWALAAYDEGNVLAGGYENGDVKIFDLRQRRVFWESNLSCGVQDVQFGGSKLTMFVGLTDGSLQAFGCFNDSMNPMKISGQQSSSRGKCVWGMDTHRQQDMIVVYNGDGELQLWEFSPKSPEMNLRKRSELLVSFEESGSVFDFRRSSHDSTIGIGISLDNLLYRFKMI